MTVPLAVTENSHPLPVLMDCVSSRAPPLSDPPWPPDPCLVNRDLDLTSSRFSDISPFCLHPEAPSAPLKDPIDSTLATTVSTKLSSDLTISPSLALWVSKLKSPTHNLKKDGFSDLR